MNQLASVRDTLVRPGTPVDRVRINGEVVLVKREDICSPFPGPQFSKIRGVVSHIAARPEQLIGVLDTYHSKAGWAVSYVCRALGKDCINFWPRFKADAFDHLREQQQMSRQHGAVLIPLKAGRSAILYHQARRQLGEVLSKYNDRYLMPNALKLPETITETAAEVLRTPEVRGVRWMVI